MKIKFRSVRLRTIRLGMALAAFLTLSSCTRMEWTLRFADSYLAWKINDLFDFTGSSRKEVKNQSSEFMRKVRREELPKWSEILSDSAAQMDRKRNDPSSNRKWVEDQWNAFEKLSASLMAQARPHLLILVDRVEKQNWDEFVQQFDSMTQKILRKPLRCKEKFEDNLSDWIGKLNPEQRQAISQYCEARGDTREERARSRQRLIKDFESKLDLPNSGFKKEAFQTAAKAWITSHGSLESFYSPEAYQRNRDQLSLLFSEILNDLTEEQRNHFKVRLQKQAELLERMSRPS